MKNINISCPEALFNAIKKECEEKMGWLDMDFLFKIVLDELQDEKFFKTVLVNKNEYNKKYPSWKTTSACSGVYDDEVGENIVINYCNKYNLGYNEIINFTFFYIIKFDKMESFINKHTATKVVFVPKTKSHFPKFMYKGKYITSFLNAYKEYLIDNGYAVLTPIGSQSTVFEYVDSIKLVLNKENYDNVLFLAININHVIREYDVRGKKEIIGKQGHNTVINALKRFREFLLEINFKLVN